MEDEREQPWAVLVLGARGRERPVGVVGAPVPCDLRLVDALLRLALSAGRQGTALRLVRVHRDLRELLELVGVADCLGVSGEVPGPAEPPALDPHPSMRSGRPKAGKSSG